VKCNGAPDKQARAPKKVLTKSTKYTRLEVLKNPKKQGVANMKKLITLMLVTILAASFLTIPALAEIGNPNGVRTTLTATGSTAEVPAYVVDAKAALGDDYLKIYGFKCDLTNNVAMFFSISFVTEEDPFPARYIGGFTNSDLVVMTYESMGLFADQWDVVDVANGSSAEFKLLYDAPLFTADNSGKLFFTEDASAASGGGTVDINNFVWLGKDGNAIKAGGASGGGGSAKTGDAGFLLWAALGAVGFCGITVLRPKKNKA